MGSEKKRLDLTRGSVEAFVPTNAQRGLRRFQFIERRTSPNTLIVKTANFIGS
jgi:hypothetical protein